MAMISPLNIENKKIIFFDGICGLCNASVAILIKLDVHDLFYFSPLQGVTFQRKDLNLTSEVASQNSIVYFKEKQIYLKSDAVLQILIDLGGPWKFAHLFFIIPKFIRDRGYELIALNRYRWFSTLDYCQLPSEEEKAKFLP